MHTPFFYVLLLLLVVLDGWLLAHPNLIGRAGVFFFDYDYVETFPKALVTVTVVISVTLLVVWLVERLGRAIRSILLIALLAISAYWLFDSFLLYNSGIYKLIGAGFRAGAILLPGLLVLVFGKGVADSLQNKPIRR